jgi:hypothetical protein
MIGLIDAHNNTRGQVMQEREAIIGILKNFKIHMLARIVQVIYKDVSPF